MSSIIKIQFPEDFEERYKEYRANLVGISKSTPEEIIINPVGGLGISLQDSRPFCIIENSRGYLKFSKFDKKFEISRANSQPFRLLQCLTEPFGIAKSVDTVFESIREGVKYKSKRGVYTISTDRAQKIKLIEYAIKELQKGNKLQGKLAFKWDDLKKTIWLEYLN